MSWGGDTGSLVGNCDHPCVHADPVFPDLAPGEGASVHGAIRFVEGDLNDIA